MVPDNIEHGKAVGASVLGIIACVGVLLGFVGCIPGLIVAIIGLILSSIAKKAGNVEGINKAGKVLSIIGICLNGLGLFFWGGLFGAGLMFM